MITITTGRSRNTKDQQNQKLTWHGFIERLQKPIRLKEYVADIATMDKSAISNLKDKGWYILGKSNQRRRVKDSIDEFYGVALDIDYAESGTLDTLFKALDGLDYLLHTTFSHNPESGLFKYRLLIRADRAIAHGDYVAVARLLAQKIGALDACDPVSFEYNRLMYYPVVAFDDTLFKVYNGSGKGFSVDELLASKGDTLPRTKKEIEERSRVKTMQKIGDPRLKGGVIGAFCKAYSIEDAMAHFIPEVYEQSDNPSRYTYTLGSGYQGVVVYNLEGVSFKGGSLWLYSHHGTDPCGGQLVNAFDMVRLHRFGSFDSNEELDKPVHKRLSYQLMTTLCERESSVLEDSLPDEFEGCESELDEEVESYKEFQETLNGDADPLKKALKRFVYVESDDSVCDLERAGHESVMPLKVFRNLTANVICEVPAPTPKNPDATKQVPVAQLWLTDRKRKQVRGDVYLPNAPRIVTEEGLRYINTYRAKEWPETESRDKVAVFLKHMDTVFPNEAEREDFIGWLAYTIQHPERRCKWTPLSITTAHGTGRGWIVKLIEALLGEWNVSRVKIKHLVNGAFNEFIYGKKVIVVEEVDDTPDAKTRFQVSANLRDTLDADRLLINAKFKSAKTQRIFANFFFMSNNPDALVIPDHDRRIYPMRGALKPESADYFQRLYKALDDREFLAQVFWFLKTKDISKFNAQVAKNSSFKQEITEAGRSELELILRDYIAEQATVAHTTAQIINGIAAAPYNFDTSDANLSRQISAIMRKTGHTLKRIRLEGQLPRIWWSASVVWDAKEAKETYLTLESKQSDDFIDAPA